MHREGIPWGSPNDQQKAGSPANQYHECELGELWGLYFILSS